MKIDTFETKKQEVQSKREGFEKIGFKVFKGTGTFGQITKNSKDIL